MYFNQFYLACLAQASYLIGSGGEAAVVDPRRDVDEYLEEAAANGLQIRYVIETHLHADFVSGHRELAERTGAEIVFGACAGAEFPHRAVVDGDELRLGSLILRIIETPGHTPESISILIIDEDAPSAPPKLLTGDTLFIGDVGRPDLAGSKGFTAVEMAGMLYDTLQTKILTLRDETEVFPAHGAGSMCGRNISTETSSTIGHQRRSNYALLPMSRPDFVKLMTADLPRMPAYFAADAERNRAGAPALADLTPPAALPPAEFSRLQATGHLVLDTRPAAEFGAGHIPNSLNIGLGGRFAGWSGDFIPLGSPILLVTSTNEQVHEAVVRLARVGHETVRGFLADGIEAWTRAGLPLSSIPQIGFPELDRLRADAADLQILDVRRPDEYQAGHVPAAINIPLDSALSEKAAAALNRSRPTAIICASGYRSSTATAMLEHVGFEQLMNVTGGTNGWIQAGYPVDQGASV